MHSVILLVIIILSTQLHCSSGHGLMVGPRSRNLIAYERKLTFCPHCLNAGGLENVRNNDVKGGVWVRNYPETDETVARHGICGDAPGEDTFMWGGKIYGTPSDGDVQNWYTEGSSIDITIDVRVHHHGWFEFQLCDMTDKNNKLTQSCLNEHKLVRDPEDPSESPIDQNFPGRYYMIPVCAYNFQMQTMRYKLPKGLTCEHCVLQWYWVTANSCYGGGYSGVDFPATYQDCIGDGNVKGWYPRNLDSAKCTEQSTSYPEEFWNCADIAIYPQGTSIPPTPQPKPYTPTVYPTRAPFGGDADSTSAPTPFPSVHPTNSLPTPFPTPFPSPDPTKDSSSQPGGTTCIPVWKQCGGTTFEGTGSCCEGYKCTFDNKYYSQCEADPDRKCFIKWEKCTTDSDCCSGYTCQGDQWYKSCK